MVLIFFGILWFLDVVRILLNGIIADDFCEISIFYKKVAENYLNSFINIFSFSLKIRLGSILLQLSNF